MGQTALSGVSERTEHSRATQKVGKADQTNDGVASSRSGKRWGLHRLQRSTQRKLARWRHRAGIQRSAAGLVVGTSVIDNASSNVRREVYLRRLGISRGSEARPPVTPRAPANVDLNSTLLDNLAMESVLGDLEREDSKSSSMSDMEMAVPTLDSLGSIDSFVSTDASSGNQTPAGTCTSEAESFLGRSKSQDGRARMKFLGKLSYQGVWLPKPQRAPTHQTLIIFDWDDTLLCTSFLNKWQGLTVSPQVQETLQACEQASAELLNLAMSLGQTFIITNAVTGWVESSAECWAPSLLPLLEKVRVISARSRHEEAYPHQPGKWKEDTFLELSGMLDSEVITNIISLGDCEYEMKATQAMGDTFKQASIKLVKFADSPSPEELLKQLKLMIGELDRIVGKAKGVRMTLRRQANA